MPRRDNRFDYTKPVDGSDPRTDWNGLHAVAELPNTINPADRLGVQQQRLALFGGRALFAEARRFPSLSRHGRRELSHDPCDAPADASPAAGASIGCRAPPTTARSRHSKCSCRCWLRPGRRLPANDPRRARLAEPIAALASWDKRWSIASVPNTLAQFWGDELAKLVDARGSRTTIDNMFRHMEAAQRRRRSSRPSTPASTGLSATSAAGACRGARSTASSASRR